MGSSILIFLKIRQVIIYANAYTTPVTSALHGFITPLPAVTAATPDKKPLQSERISYL
jgi:hypothetical protein